MNLCNNCGAILPADAQDVCPVCGAEQVTGSSKEAELDGTAKKKSKAPKILAIIAAVLAVLLAAACIAATLLYNRFNLDRDYNIIGEALLDNDIDTLRSLVVGDGIDVTDDDLQALCDAFTAESSVNALVTQLKQQAAGVQGAVRYTALSAVSEPVFLGYNEYKLQASPVSIRVPAAVTSPLLTVNGHSRTGVLGEDGVTYSGLFPGSYTCVLSAEAGTGERVTGSETALTLLDSASPTVFEGALPIATITITECVSDDAVIFIDGERTDIHPSGHTVTLPNIPVGTTISMEYLTAYGATTTASVQFTDVNQTQLAFANHVTEGGVPDEATLNSLLGAYFSSYLDSLNAQDIAQLLSSTALNAERLAPGIATQQHKDTLYTFTSAACQYTGVQQTTFEETPAIVCNAEFKYTATDRESKEATEMTDYQTCELVFNYDAAAWQVNRVMPLTADQFAAGTLAEIA